MEKKKYIVVMSDGFELDIRCVEAKDEFTAAINFFNVYDDYQDCFESYENVSTIEEISDTLNDSDIGFEVKELQNLIHMKI